VIGHLLDLASLTMAPDGRGVSGDDLGSICFTDWELSAIRPGWNTPLHPVAPRLVALEAQMAELRRRS
jgi:hypothetical protein